MTSPGAETSLDWLPPTTVERLMIERNPLLKWCDLAHRGYLTLELTRDRAACEWQLLDSVRQRSTAIAARHRMMVEAGSNRLSA